MELNDAPSPNARRGGTLPQRFRVHQVLFGGLGGHASVALSLIGATPHLRHSVTFFATEPPRPEHIAFCRQNDVAWTPVVKARGVSPAALAAVLADLRRRRPELLLVHSPTTLPAALAYGLPRRVPTVVVDHLANAAKERREWLALAASLVSATHVVFLTPQFVPEVTARLGPLVNRARISVISNGVDTERFRPGPATSPTTVTLSMLSRFSPLRDHASLVAAIHEVLERQPRLRDGLRVVLGGDGETWNDVRADVARRNLDDVIALPGVLDENGVLECLQSTDVYVHSSFAETMSTSVMQAMAVGVPVIATEISGMDYLIENGRTGLLVPPGQPALLAQAIQGLLRDAARREALAQAARADAVARLSVARMAREYEALALQLTGRGAYAETGCARGGRSCPAR